MQISSVLFPRCLYALLVILETGERDFLVMRHSLEVEKVDEVSGREGVETVNVCMVQYGDPYGFSAMSKWVGLPCALAAKMVLRGTIY